MSLYTYTIYLLRESSRGALLPDLEAAGLVRSVGAEIELLGLVTERSEHQLDCGLTVVTLAPDDTRFDALLRSRGTDFVRWLWTAFEVAGALYAFIPGGGDVKYEEDGVSTEMLVFPQLRELVETGTVRVVHPLMMFATRLGHSRPCERARALAWGLTEHREGIGCLLALAEVTPDGLVIHEPGSLYPVLRNEWA